MLSRHLLSTNSLSITLKQAFQGIITLFMLGLSCIASANAPKPAHGIAMHDKPMYPADFTHFKYVNPNAPKGGDVTLSARGTFDSFNPFVAKGTVADDLSLIYDSLTTSSGDEPFTQYGLVAKSLEMPVDRSWIIFNLNQDAAFHDGHKIDAGDVIFSFNALMEHGSPIYKSMYGEVKSVTALSNHKVKFDLGDGSNKELPLIIGQLSVLPEHFWKDKDFSKADLTVPLGSGPYKIGKFDPGRSVVLERVKDYWAINHPVNKGKYNYDEVTYDYYRDGTVIFEALKAGKIDFRYENSSKQWATGYTGPAVESGKLKQLEIPHQNPTGMQGFLINQRNPIFADINVRKALNYSFDYEWTNANLFYNAYSRTDSYFSNSELASSGLPSGRELEILTPYKDRLPESVFTTAFANPVSDGKGFNRKNLRQAKKLLKQAGWTSKNGQLVDKEGKPFTFEILIYDSTFERVVNPWVKSLQKLGIKASVRKVEIPEYINRLRGFEFDMIILTVAQSLSPGNEQIEFWNSKSADIQGSRNYMGIKNPVIDELINKVVEAPTRAELVAASRALDRVLLHHHYAIPQWHVKQHRLAFWDKFGHPDVSMKYDAYFQDGFWTWWIKN